jgi:hypothetical protein
VLGEGEEDLKVPEWLNDVTLYHNRGDTTFAGENAYYGDFFGLDDLFTEHPRVVEGMIDIYRTWVDDVGIDGYRIDTMKHVNDEFWQAFGPAVLTYARDEAGKDEFFMFGEVFDGSRAFTSRYTTTNDIQAVLDFPFQGAARSFASQSGDATVLEELFVGDDWYTDADSNVYQLPTFLGNHDVGRIGAFLLQDNPGAEDAELLARSRLAHELMYLSRGNPVVYYGDEQGFTGELGFEGSRQSMFPSQVAAYLDDDLIGTDATHAEESFELGHPLYQAISRLADLTEAHPALRDGAHQHRYAADGPGVYAFSRIAPDEQREYVVALNNAETAQTATIPAYSAGRPYQLLYGDGPRRVRAGRDGGLEVEVPALSAVVYRSAGRIPPSTRAPRITLAEPRPTQEANSRLEVGAEVAGSSFYEVTFQARIAGGDWTTIGTDDTAPYRVFHDVRPFDPGTEVEYRAVVLDNRGHTRVSGRQGTTVPAPTLALEVPAEGGEVSGDEIEVRAVADPDRSTHVVTISRSLDGGETWEDIATDDSSPVHTAFDDVTDLDVGAQVRYRATLVDGETTVTSDVRTVTVVEAAQPDAVAVAGSFNVAIGCAEDWAPACEAAQLELDEAAGLWQRTFRIPAGTYQYKAALDGGWTENYGAGGVFNGPNIALDLAADSDVTFTYDHETHVVTHAITPAGG